MKRPDAMKTKTVYIEISAEWFRALWRGTAIELPVKRQANDHLDPSTRSEISMQLKQLLKRNRWESPARALVAIGGRGVVFRRLSLPAVAQGDVDKFLTLQIEREFPVAAEDLAWGYRKIQSPEPGEQSGPASEYLIMAVRREAIAEYHELLKECGLKPVFTLAALARTALCPDLTGTFSLLDIGRQHSEIMTLHKNLPTGIRNLSWGFETFVPEAVGQVAPPGEALYLTGEKCSEVASRLKASAPPQRIISCVEPLESPGGMSATLSGLRKLEDRNGNGALLTFNMAGEKARSATETPALRKWVLAGSLLALACLAYPYAEAVLMKEGLSKRVAEMRSSRGQLSLIDQGNDFLQFLQVNQPPYLDAAYLISAHAPPGTKVENLSLNRRGEVSLRAIMQNSQQIHQFRSKMIDSGFFAQVVVEEQSPTPDRQRMNVRMTAQWKPYIARQTLKIGPSPEELEKIKTAAQQLLPAPGGGGLPPGGMMPPGLSGPIPGGAPMPVRTIKLPPGVQLPPGFQLPPGVKLE